MTINAQDLINSIMESLSRIDHISSDSIPNIDLYMDQVTTFMDKHLKNTKRSDEDKVLTKTMINNYAKNHLLPPPEKKKYSKDHVLILIFIYYFKNILSINDIQTMLNPLTEKYYNVASGHTLKDIYEEVFSMESNQIDSIKEDIMEKFNLSTQTFTDFKEDDKEMLTLFSFICLLSFDVYIKKLLVEKIVDSMFTESNDKSKEKEKKSENTKKEPV